jgi:hypothetical protein
MHHLTIYVIKTIELSGDFIGQAKSMGGGRFSLEENIPQPFIGMIDGRI